MTLDKNKSIASIEYNHLNLPAKVTKNDGQCVKYIYNAAGGKMSQEVYDASNVLKKKADYLGEFFYENDTLKFINHEEGRIVMTGVAPEYQYTLKDHLGNTRITFTSKHEIETFTANLDPGNAEEEQNTFGAYNSYINEPLDPTPAESASDQILVLNGSALMGSNNGQVGLTKSFAVVPGDVVTASVNAKFFQAGGGGNLTGFAAALTQAFLLTPGPQPIEGITPFEALNAFGTVIASGGRDENDNLPQGFLNVLVFDKEYNLVDAAFEQVGTSATLTSSLQIRQAGYVYIFLSNDGASQQEIGFDNYSLTHEHSDVVQQDDYYPFGLTFNSYQRESSVKQKFKFQGQEHIDDLDLGWDSFKWRNHDPTIARFFNGDPLADKYVYNSPYVFSENRVIDGVELEGLEWSSIKDDKSKTIVNTVQIKVRNSSSNITQAEAMALAMDIENKAEEVLSGKDSDGYTHTTLVTLDFESEVKEGDFYMDFVDAVEMKDGTKSFYTAGRSEIGETQSNRIQVNTGYLDKDKDRGRLTKTGAHEIGHTGGLTHPSPNSQQPGTDDSGNYLPEGNLMIQNNEGTDVLPGQRKVIKEEVENDTN